MKKFKIVAFIALIVLFIFIGVRFLISPSKEEPVSISYSEFLSLIESQEVNSVELQEGESLVEATLFDSTKVLAEVPNQDMFLDFIQDEILYFDNPINLEMIPEEVGISSFILNLLLTLVISVYLGSFLIMGFKYLMKQISGDKHSNNSNFLNIANVLNTDINFVEKLSKSDVRFSDVAALDEEKKELEEVVDFIKNPDKYLKLGAKIPRGILLSGMPGTGKTLLAKAVAGEASVAYLAVSGSEFVEKYVGVGAQRIRGLFKEARKQAPCIIFIDEIDSIGAKRGNGNDERNQTLEQLLIELDGFKDRTDIVILGATNRLDSLDPALVRPGRFDRKVIVHLPDVKGRWEILKVHARNKKFLDDVDFYRVACNTAGYSGAELENLLNEAALMAARNRHEVIHKSDIDEAQKKLLVGLQKSGRIISEKELKITAVHEAGHAVVSKLLPTQASVKEISIVPRGAAGGYTMHETIEDKQYISRQEFKEKLIVLLAGRVAESLFIGDISTGASNDLEVATEEARKMIMIYGMDDDLGPISFKNDSTIDYLGEHTLDVIWEKVGNILKESENNALQLIKANEELLKLLTQLLLSQETVTGEELDSLITEYQKNNTLVANT